MKFFKTALLPALAAALLLGACSGSESYRGEWKAVASDGSKSDGSKAEITFAEKSFTVKDEKGKEAVYEYTQNQYKLESGRTSYGIDIKNASEARIVFPFKGKADRATMVAPDDTILYMLDRHAYVPAAMVAPDDTILYMLDRHAYVPADQFWKLPQ